MGHNRKTCPQCLEEAKDRESSWHNKVDERLKELESKIDEVFEVIRNLMDK